MNITLFTANKNFERNEKLGWSNQEIADFYRAIDILKRSGLEVEVDSGVTDEGEPWFVFVRTTDGEVLAHFAEIGGEFIAVSSMNHEVYKGSNIRQIVDRMMDRHPVVMPRNTGNNSLLLHPTAAITAFLAAAFILNVEGVRASNLKEVLVSVASGGAAGVAETAILLQGNGKTDTAKWGAADTVSMNYNVVILGAALIAHELTSAGLLEDEPKETDIVDVAFDEESREPASKNEISSLAEDIKYNSFANIEGMESHDENADVEVAANLSSNKGKPTEEANKDQVEIIKGLTSENLYSKNAAILSSDYMGLFDPQKSKAQVEYRDSVQSLDLTTLRGYNDGINLQMVMQNDPSKMINTKEPNRDFEVYFEETGSNIGLASIFPIDSLGITVDGLYDINLVSFQSRDLPNGLLVLANAPSSELTKIPSTVGLFSAGTKIEIDNNSASFVEDPVIVTKNAEPEAQLPIVGHLTIDANHAVKMTTGIDVVFYQGGAVEVQGFELGVDLLWFFLSAEELAKGESSVNQQGDVILDFADTGSLVFLGMVSQSSDDLII